MNEHEHAHDRESRPDSVVRKLPVLAGQESGVRPRRSGLVVDLTGVERLDLTSLALLLTAQQSAQEQGREVWLVGVPLKVWESLHTMGLGSYFRPFPISGEADD